MYYNEIVASLLQPKIIPPTEASLDRILKYIERLQKADSPLEKLENLLAAISAIFNSVSSSLDCCRRRSYRTFFTES